MGSASKLFQELIQENRAASPGFLLIVVMLIRGLYKVDLIPPSTLPISKYIYHLAGQIFVNNLDFNIMNSSKELTNKIITRC